MKAIVSAITIVALSTTAVSASTATPLSAGRPAGVQQAQLEGGTGMIVLAGVAAIGMGIALATANSGPGLTPGTPPGSTTTSSTSSTGTP